jgi:hypothetical protein
VVKARTFFEHSCLRPSSSTTGAPTLPSSRLGAPPLYWPAEGLVSPCPETWTGLSSARVDWPVTTSPVLRSSLLSPRSKTPLPEYLTSSVSSILSSSAFIPSALLTTLLLSLGSLALAGRAVRSTGRPTTSSCPSLLRVHHFWVHASALLIQSTALRFSSPRLPATWFCIHLAHISRVCWFTLTWLHPSSFPCHRVAALD